MIERDAAEAIRGGSMPPWFYAVMHPKAELSAAEKDALIKGLAATFAVDPPRGGGG